MAFDFPSSPAEGQIFNAPGGPSYVFNTPVWKAVGQGQIAIISDTPPPSPANGALWYESDSGILFIWYNDGNSSQWVQVGGIQAGAPVPPAADNAEYVMVNGAWRLKSQMFDLTGLAQKDIAVPSWAPSNARLTVEFLRGGPTASTYRISTDGTTFPAGASDYVFGGFIHYGGTSGYLKFSDATGNGWLGGPTSDHPTLPTTSYANVALTRPAGSLFTYRVRGDNSNVAAANGSGSMFFMGYANSAPFPGTGPVLAIRWNASGAVAAGRMTVEWLP